MGLSSDLISQFVKITNDTNKSKKETTAYGTVVDHNGGTYVRLDGSDLLTPMTKTVGVKDGDRVTISIKDHTATVTGNISSPSASSSELKAVDDKVGNFTTVTTKELIAQSAKIEDLTADNVTIKDKLTANEGYISYLQADNLTINKKLTANEAEVKKLTADYVEINSLVAKKASIDDLEATNASVHNLASDYGNFKELTTDKFTANEASIKKLDTDKANITDLNAATAEINKLLAKKASIDDLDAANARIDTLTASQITTDYLKANYANIDLANVNNAWIQNGIIKNGAIGEAAIRDGAITNVKIADATIEAAKIKTINADTITAGTLKTNRLIITGEDGTDSIVKAINTANGVAEANSTKIQAASIDVVDLSAFNAKIAQFILKDNAIYSGKTSITDPTSGIYISTTGIGVGNGALVDSTESPIQMYADGGMKLKGKNGSIDFNTVTGDLTIDASSLKIGSKTVASNEDVTNAINNIEVGGRNYMLDSAFSKYTPDGSNITKDGEIVTFNGSDPKNSIGRKFSDDFKSSVQGKKLALSMDIKVNEEIAFGTTNPWIGFEISVNYTDDTHDWLDLLGGKRLPTGVADWKRYTSIVAVKDKEINSIGVSIVCRDFTGSISIRHPKVEISTKATDWTPAPEDIHSDLDAVKTRVASAETSIAQNSTDISLRATKTELTNAVSGINTTIGELETSIQENANAITLRATKTEVTTEVSNAVNNIEVGGRNLILDSDVWTSSGSTSKGITASREDGALKVVSTSGNGNWLSFTRKNVIEANLNDGDPFTFSMEIKSEDGTKPPSIYFKSGMGYYGFNGSVSSDYSWVHYTGVWKKENDISFHLGWLQAIGTYYIRKIKFEKGNKPTDWSPAPEDIDSDVTTAKSEAISAAATDATAKADKAKTDAISTAATDATTKANNAKSEAISTAATDATTKANTALANAKTYTDAQIKISADSITSTVSKTYQTKSGMSNYLTTASAANTYSKKQLPDTRNDNQPPSWYMTNYPRQVVTEFKYSNIIGLPKNETYCTLETTVPWNDKSGGYPKQRAQMAGKVYYRIGISESEWGIWKDTLDTATADSTYATSKSLEAVSGNLNAYVESSTNMIQDINGWQFNWNKILRADEAHVEEHQDYITFQNGDIILGESGSELKVKIGNDAIQFKGENGSETAVTPDSDATAWITGQLFNINAGEIHTSLKVGNLQFTPRPNGNFSITIT